MRVNIWILVHVWRGLVQEPEVFFDENTAEKRKSEMLRTFNPAYDECELFMKTL